MWVRTGGCLMNRERKRHQQPHLGMWITVKGAKQGLTEGRRIGLGSRLPRCIQHVQRRLNQSWHMGVYVYSHTLQYKHLLHVFSIQSEHLPGSAYRVSSFEVWIPSLIYSIVFKAGLITTWNIAAPSKWWGSLTAKWWGLPSAHPPDCSGAALVETVTLKALCLIYFSIPAIEMFALIRPRKLPSADELSGDFLFFFSCLFPKHSE